MGLKLGVERLYTWTRDLGFGQLTGISLPGENIGIVAPFSQWNERDFCLSVPMGHAVAVTPLQMACAHAAVANGGEWLPPQIVKDVFNLDPRTGERHHMGLDRGQPKRRIFSPQDALNIQEAMILTMTAGTGRRLQLKGYTSAGKTGTSEKYQSEEHVGSFVGWAPASLQRRTEFLALAVVDEPQKNGHYGGQTAGPIVQDILQYALESYNVVPDIAVAMHNNEGR